MGRKRHKPEEIVRMTLPPSSVRGFESPGAGCSGCRAQGAVGDRSAAARANSSGVAPPGEMCDLAPVDARPFGALGHADEPEVRPAEHVHAPEVGRVVADVDASIDVGRELRRDEVSAVEANASLADQPSASVAGCLGEEDVECALVRHAGDRRRLLRRRAGGAGRLSPGPRPLRPRRRGHSPPPSIALPRPPLTRTPPLPKLNVTVMRSRA